jgi:hypothetical protein
MNTMKYARCCSLTFALLGHALLPACASEGASDLDGGASGAGDTDASGPSALFGYFNLKLNPMKPATPTAMAIPAQASLIGAFRDGPTPDPDPWALLDEQGGCQLLAVDQPFCDPPCGSDAECVGTRADDTAMCVTKPEPLGAGTVHVTGLGAAFDMERVGRNYQLAAGTSLSYPPCEEGDDVRFAAEGDGFEPFELTAPCVVPMEFPGPLAFETDMPLSVVWTPGLVELARVHVAIDISHHGGARGLIECDVPDTGSLEIAAPMVQGLIDLGVSGFPTITLTRAVRAEGSTAEAAQVELTISSTYQNHLDVPNLTSCTQDAQCPSGQSCQFDFRCE